MVNSRRCLLILPAALLASVTAASAEWIVTPYAGITWGTAATFNDVALSYDDEFAGRASVGAAAGWNSGPFTVEFDFGYHPGLFADRKADDDFEFGSSRVMTAMANALWAAPFRFAGLRPYGAGGIGIVRTSIDDEFEIFAVRNTNTAFNVGGGVMRPIGRYVLRADARYFRTVQEQLPEREVDVALGQLRFWRFSGGLTMGF